MAPLPPVITIYLAGLIQGLGLVTFPALSIIFTSPQYYGFGADRYGLLFIPQVIGAVLGSILAVGRARTWGMKRVLLSGLALNLTAMALLLASRLFIGQPAVAYSLLLLATAALGTGFGMTLTLLNLYVVGFFPTQPDSAVTALHALLGTGTALAPLLVALFVARGVWWWLPVVVAVGLVVLIISGARQPLKVALHEEEASGWSLARLRRLPARFWTFAAVVFLYGACETLFGNWGPLYLQHDRSLPADVATGALAAFWAMVTVGRVGIALLSTWVPARWSYLGLPVLIMVALLVIPQVGGPIAGILAFGFAGLGCSAFFPLSISFAEREFAAQAAIASGGLVIVYQFGYGLAAFGVGPLQNAGLGLATIYGAASLLAVLLFALAVILARRAVASVTP